MLTRTDFLLQFVWKPVKAEEQPKTDEERNEKVKSLFADLKKAEEKNPAVKAEDVEKKLESASRKKSDLSWLTPRESEILGEMAKGKSNAAIATSLQVSERAVEKHTNSIFSKLGLTEERDLNRRVKAVLVYLSDPAGG